MQNVGKRAMQALPILLLVALTAVGLAGALQGDEEEVDYGPQATDFVGEDGVDIGSYLVAVAAFESAPPVPRESELGEEDDPIEYRVFGCAEDAGIVVELVPRGLIDFEQEANDALDADDETKLLEEPVTLVEEDSTLPEPALYEINLPVTTPIGFNRLVHTCTDPDGEELKVETVINVVDREDFEASQEDVDEPEEIVTLLDSDNAPS